jgi:hypothetical protein
MAYKGAVLPVFAVLLAAGGCAPRYDDAVVLEGQGRLLKAAQKYTAFAQAKPRDPAAPKALMAAAQIYSLKLGLCAESRPLLENLARNYRDFKMPGDVFRQIFICPDYFPAGPGLKWTYGDSQTFGRNARQETEVTDHVSGGAALSIAFYAGHTLVNKQKKNYRFSAMDFMERQNGKDTVLLSYPLEAGKTWTTSGPEGRLEFRVEQTGLNVKVKAGTFEDCVKIRRRVAGQPSWVYEYYAPWKGRVLTSVAGKGYENRIMELISYEEKK